MRGVVYILLYCVLCQSSLWLPDFNKLLVFLSCLLNMWNSLPNCVVRAESTDIFKKQLDKFWSNQEVIYNYHSKIQGTGS